jgi:DNA-binding PadR family transcriptional regulator
MISDIEASVLGLVCEGFRYGYEIEKIIEERNMRNWTDIAFSSIYYVLKKLENAGLITSESQSAGGRSRKVYEVTEEGRREMRDKVGHLLSNHAGYKSPFDLGLGFMGQLGKAEAIDALEAYIGSFEEMRAHYRGRLEVIERSDWPFHIRALCTRPLALLDAEQEWIEAFIVELREHNRPHKEAVKTQ